MPKIGAHVSAAVSLETSFTKAKNIGAECMQIFVSPPQQWLQTKHDEAEVERFVQAQKESEIGPNFIHGTYLINLGTSSPKHLQKSIDWLIWAMGMADKLGIEGVIFHTGSHKGVGFEKVKGQIVNALSVILNASEGSQDLNSNLEIPRSSKQSLPSNEGRNDKKKPYLILEISAGAGGSIGSTFHELGQILKLVQDDKEEVQDGTPTPLSPDRLKVCLDTCHAFAAGYDVKSLIGLNDVLEEFEQEIGLQNLVAIHANDTKFDLKSGKDRHENIGDGFIGKEGFENMLNHPKLEDIPFILEVPGYTDNGPDSENIQTLKSLIKSN
jgi:deoxyribonuclease-4